MSITTFPFRKAKALFAKARDAARRVTIEIDDGLTDTHVDALNLLTAFPTLKVKSGWTLFTQQYSDGYNANGFTWAYPKGAPLPPPDLRAWPTEKPPHAEPPMTAIEGNGTPWSYLSASFLARELEELGAQWHGCTWADHNLYGGGPLPRAGGEWTYTGPRPGSYSPSVTLDPAGITVIFYTVTGLGQYRLQRHTDHYHPDRGLCANSEAHTIAQAEGGFIF